MNEILVLLAFTLVEWLGFKFADYEPKRTLKKSRHVKI